MLQAMVAGTAQGIATIGGMQFAHVAGGDFRMGHTDYADAPVRSTRVRDFKMGVAPVTNSQMNAYISAMEENTHGTIGVGRDGREHILARGPDGGSKALLKPAQHPHLVGITDLAHVLENIRLVPDPSRYQQLSADVFANANHPAVLVSWREAVAFAAWVSHISGVLVRLPSEAEWELAAKGGIGNNHDYATPDGKLRDAQGKLQAHVEHWDKSDEQYGTAAVQSNGANPLGIYDLSGNVWEWIMDLYAPSYDMNANNNPIGPSEGRSRVLRGGSWNDSAECARSAGRGVVGPELRSDGVGFRLASPAAPQDSKPA
ncbi:formylglycine-generating enzyme family protein [bacterium]|nr:formylglycine-generating enzyme family protein [bacterium]MBU1918689.1 formylglycine-generating enzyme family protein [bacterium]